MTLETWRVRYPTIISGKLENLKLREALRKESGSKSFLWSTRLSTGLFGLPRCPSANKEQVPKGENEILFAFGDKGLAKLIDLGFIPCISCHPERVPFFWEKAGEVVRRNYPNLTHVYQFANKTAVPFDVRRVDWEAIAPYLTSLPNRFYVPPNLSEKEVREFKQRIENTGFSPPPIGFYDRSTPVGFTEYKLI